MRSWYALDVDLERDALEAVEYALMEAGSLGTESSPHEGVLHRVTAYFETVPDRERVRLELFDSLRIYGLSSSAVRDMQVREVKDQDWLGEWKKDWQPVPVGRRFIVAPPWSDITGAEERIVIRIEPGMAFGTGTHETTRLCLAAIEKYFHGGSFLDVGTGTGVLAIAAAKLHPGSRVQAYDTDDEAISIARENASLNGVATAIEFHSVTITGIQLAAAANCVCANLSADVILTMMPALLSASCGQLILSGILDSQVDTIVGRLQDAGITQWPEITTAGEWACVVV
ncbi:MAG TPA: 50S ribosomal protein L11 methyltransferase [Pyrinomonadaceae bacterium]|nr:50S ribosomal protein L11 methyltransferase [Pyrinomonadaceae bacterium]